MNKLLVRVNSTYESGIGHFMRCLALAQKWQKENGYICFLINDNDNLVNRIIDENMDYIIYNKDIGTVDDALFLSKIAKDYDWVVVDGYLFNEDYFDILRENNLKFLLFDDDGRLTHYNANIILNQNLHADINLYSSKKEDYTHLLLGSKFILLRNEFLENTGYKKTIKNQAKNILITLGGSDTNNHSLKVLKAINNSRFDDLEIIILLGANNVHEDSINSYVDENNLNVKVLRNVSNVSHIMKWADLAFSSGGTTVWELAFMGVPSIIGSVSKVEELLINGLDQYNLFKTVYSIEKLSLNDLTECFDEVIQNKRLRTEFSENGRNFVDGYGSERIIKLMEKCKNE